MTELALSRRETLLEMLGYPDWNTTEVQELEGYFGIPDVVFGFGKTCSNGRRIIRIVSFEFKRENWKRALIQAYRYSSFSDYSYVVLDQCYIRRALKNLSEFKRTNIGLISIDVSGFIQTISKPKLRKPYSQSLREGVRHRFESDLFD